MLPKSHSDWSHACQSQREFQHSRLTLALLNITNHSPEVTVPIKIQDALLPGNEQIQLCKPNYYRESDLCYIDKWLLETGGGLRNENPTIKNQAAIT